MLVFLQRDFTTGGPAPSRGRSVHAFSQVLCLVGWSIARGITSAADLDARSATDAGAQSAVDTGGAQMHRPRIGLVLSGGGARGAAHVGVLKVLEQMRIPIDAIAGTSMGAVVGGLYASGLTAREIEAIMTSLNWQDAFRDRPPREDLTFRRKQEDQNFLVKFPLGCAAAAFSCPRDSSKARRSTRLCGV